MLNDLITDSGLKYPKLVNEHSPLRQGKSAAFSRGVNFVESDIIIFTDANTMLNKDAVKEIVYCFNNPLVGCVAGEKRVSANMNYKGEYIDGNDDTAVATEGVYWQYESKLKEWDWQLNSAIGAAGELFAIRRDLFESLPSNILLDDFILSMRIVMKGYKIAYCKEAYAIDRKSVV